MGLDMYLLKETYVKNWDHMTDEEKHQVTVLKNGVPVSHIKPERIYNVVEEVGYWRKANQIHKWFVDNTQDGEDRNGKSYVSEDQLKELLELCKTVLASCELIDSKIANGYSFDNEGNKIPSLVDGKTIKNPSLAKELLPTQSGFFFGSEDYDEYYVEDLKHTIEIIETALKDSGNSSFYYEASW